MAKSAIAETSAVNAVRYSTDFMTNYNLMSPHQVRHFLCCITMAPLAGAGSSAAASL